MRFKSARSLASRPLAVGFRALGFLKSFAFSTSKHGGGNHAAVTGGADSDHGSASSSPSSSLVPVVGNKRARIRVVSISLLVLVSSLVTASGTGNGLAGVQTQANSPKRVSSSSPGIDGPSAGPLLATESSPVVAIDDATIDVGNRTTVDLTLSSAPNGLSGYKINVTVDDGSVAEFTGASYPSNTYSLTDTQVADGNRTISLKAVDLSDNVGPGATDIDLASVEIQGKTRGETNLTIDVVQMDTDDDGGDVKAINPTTDPGTVTVMSPGVIDQCTVISSPGRYTLAGDILNVPSQSCIDVRSSDVVLDGNGHAVDGDGFAVDDQSSAIRVHSDSRRIRNVTVEDIEMTEWDRAITVSNTTESVVRNVTAVGNGDGVLTILNSSEMVLSGANLSNYAEHGIVVAKSQDIEIRDSIATGNGRGGILLYQSNRTVVEETRIGPGSVNGIYDQESTETTIRNNSVRGTDYAITVDGSSDALVAGNSVSDTDELGIRLNRGSSGTVVRENNVSRSSTAFVVKNASSGNRLADNVAHRSSKGYELIDVTGNVLESNRAVETNRAFISDEAPDNDVNRLTIGRERTTVSLDGKNVALEPVENPPADPVGKRNITKHVVASSLAADSFLNLSVHYEDEDLAEVPESTLDLWKFDDGSWTEVPGSRVNTTENVVSGNLTSFSVLAPLGNESADGLTAAFSIKPNSPRVNETVTFNASLSSDTDGRIETYEWDFDSDGSVDQSGSLVTHQFNASGNYSVKLTVTNQDGQKATTLQTVEVSLAEPILTGRQTIPGIALPGETVDVTVNLQANQSATGPALDIDTPQGYEIIDQSSSPSATYRSSEEQWVWLQADTDDQLTVTYSLRVPDNATVGETVRLNGTVSTALQDPVDISGDRELRIGNCVDGSIAGPDRIISLREIQIAILWWANDNPVPNTGGKILSLRKIQRLIFDWARDNPVGCQVGSGG